MKHKWEQTNAEKEVIKRQLEQVRSKVKQQDILEIKQSKGMPEEAQASVTQYSTQQNQQPQQQQQQQKLHTLQDLRKERKIKKLGTQKTNEPRVIADELMDEEQEESESVSIQQPVERLKRANTTGDMGQQVSAKGYTAVSNE